MIQPTKDVLNAFGLTEGDVKDDKIDEKEPPSTRPSSNEPSSSNLNTCEVEADGNTSNKRGKWSKNAISMLINLRIEYNKDFTSTTQKNDVTWKIISNKMKLHGVYMTPTQCNDKWRYLKGKYVAAKDNRGDRGSGEEPMDFPYFQVMDDFLGKKHNVNPIAVASSIKGDTGILNFNFSFNSL